MLPYIGHAPENEVYLVGRPLLWGVIWWDT